ncbi:hypothetical protein NTH58_001550 [Enterobacter oligotrophicus]|nr:hypothetical protein [Enterobacter oligotrophicus]
MSIKSIKLDNEISDPEFVAISIQARKSERAHLLGLLRIRLGQLKNESASPDEIYTAIESWINNRELTTRNGDK